MSRVRCSRWLNLSRRLSPFPLVNDWTDGVPSDTENRGNEEASITRQAFPHVGQLTAALGTLASALFVLTVTLMLRDARVHRGYETASVMPDFAFRCCNSRLHPERLVLLGSRSHERDPR